MIALLAAAFGSPAEVRACLDRIDLACANAALEADGAETSGDPDLLAALAATRFHEGRYPEASDAMNRAVAAGFGDPLDEKALYERTLYATANWVEEARGRFAVRFRPGLDAMLVDDAFEAIEGSDANIGPLLGGSPPGVSRVEVFPDVRSFGAASSLTRDDIETTGVVGLAKWSRVLVTSPRALARGYSWQDTIAHEYVHLMVAHHSADRSPVWLQEAIAKYLEPRWRHGTFQPSVRQQGQLAKALRDDDLVPFEEMHPSLAKLPSAERASLAYAQLAMLMAYCFEQGGDDVLLRVLPRVAAGVDPREALAAGAGAADFAALEAAWREWLARQPLVARELAELPVVLEGGDDTATDPLLAERKDLAKFLTLGDLLRERGFAEAAIVEYQKAVPPSHPPSPTLSARLGQAHQALGQLAEARKVLEDSLVDYPEYALTHRTLGEIRFAEQAYEEARAELEEALRISPFDPDARAQLLEACRRLGDRGCVERQTRLLEIRKRGGDEVERAVIHDRVGEYEAPRKVEPTPEERAADADAWVGRVAPEFTGVARLDGRVLTLESLRGKVVVVDFWATWCGPCKAAMPHLSALQDAHPDALMVVGLTNEPTGLVKGFLTKKPVSYTIALDSKGATNRDYEVSALPTALVIDRKGRVVKRIVGGGPNAEAALDAAVTEALAAPASE